MYPLDYIQPVFRPPSEARSLILQVTNGCSYNRCTFCEMYTDKQKRFSPKPIETIEQELCSLTKAGYPVTRIFLADGDAMTLILKEMNLAGYVLTVHKYKFEEYGVPQARHRIIIVGVRKDIGLEFKVPAPTHLQDKIFVRPNHML